MKWGYKNSTVTFGDDAEAYVSRLFVMMRNPNGSRRPDLISVNGRYKPKLSLEVKSGRARKGVLVDYQLHYAITTGGDYRELFGLDSENPTGILDGLDLSGSLPEKSVAYYYDIVDRVDGMKSEDMREKFANIKLNWGDQFIVPHRFGFYAFAVFKHRRTGMPLRQVIDSLWKLIREDVLAGSTTNYEQRKNSQSWQDLHGRDALAIFLNDNSIATEDGKMRIELMQEVYPGMDDLKRVHIQGPNGTSIYVLAEPEHYRLFDEQLRKTVDERREMIERITRQRKGALSLLERVGIRSTKQLALGNGHIPELELEPLTDRERDRLKMLSDWTNNTREDREFVTDEVPF